MRTLVLVDGEHYPPVTRWGDRDARIARGHDVVGALFVGGHREDRSGGRCPTSASRSTRGRRRPRWPRSRDAIDELEPEVVLDLSDEPVLGYRERMELAAVALAAGCRYLGRRLPAGPADRRPAARRAHARRDRHGQAHREDRDQRRGRPAGRAPGLDPVVVAMGRGGPPEPQVAEAGSVDLERLLELVRSGQHAASDYLEDALTTGVTTIGARRAGGGLAGAPYATNVREAAELAAARRPGRRRSSRAAGRRCRRSRGTPASSWCPPSAPPEYLGGYLGPVSALAVGPGGCYHGVQPVRRAREPLRTPFPRPPLPR